MIVLIAFVILLLLNATSEQKFTLLLLKSYEDWILDSIGLCFQGIIIPFLQITFVYQLYEYLLPSFQAGLTLSPSVAFCLSFVFVDYLYYWNHRLFHTKYLWPIHKVHHTVTEMDVLGTSRNTLWTSFFIIYLWVHALFIYLLQEPSWYILGVSLTSILDLWRHSKLTPRPNSFLYKFLSTWLILPENHAWHHSSNNLPANYGANLKIWDKIHSTYYECEQAPEFLGSQTKLTLIQKLFLPFYDSP